MKDILEAHGLNLPELWYENGVCPKGLLLDIYLPPVLLYVTREPSRIMHDRTRSLAEPEASYKREEGRLRNRH